MRITLGGKREPASGSLAIEEDLVLVRASRLELRYVYQGVMMPLDVEGARAAPQHLDLAGGIRLDPDGSVGFTSIAQQRAGISSGIANPAGVKSLFVPHGTFSLLPG